MKSDPENGQKGPHCANVGLMDSGLGGLSVLTEVRKRLPGIDLLYFADTAHCPYGLRPPEFVRERTYEISRALIDQGAAVVVVACNTASAAALEWLRARVSVPVVGMEPAIKPAAQATRNGRVGVLATGVTLEAQRFESLLERFAEGIQVFSEPAPDLVPLVEKGLVSGPEVEAAVRAKLDRLVSHHIDTLVLGCTHYPFLKAEFARRLGDEVAIIDTGPSVAEQTVRVFEAACPGRGDGTPGRNYLMTSGDPEAVLAAASRLTAHLSFRTG